MTAAAEIGADVAGLTAYLVDIIVFIVFLTDSAAHRCSLKDIDCPQQAIKQANLELLPSGPTEVYAWLVSPIWLSVCRVFFQVYTEKSVFDL